MEKGWKIWALAALFAWVIPWISASLLLPDAEPVPEESQAETGRQEQTIPVLQGGELLQMPLEEYVAGVILGEMPASFHREAKLAQAVAARTYALRTVKHGDKHPGAVCTDSGCCQSWADPAACPEEAVMAARDAAEATRGLVLTYGGELIDAVYFSCSGGRTEDARAVWGGDVPYLQSVESPGEEGAAHYREETVWLEREFLSALGLTGSLRLGAVRYTAGGGVDTMVICGKKFTGTRLRSLLGLRSTAITLIPETGQVRVITQGYGHRVGMSQYGAQAMAQQGSSYREILMHYYPGTQIAESR